MDVNELVRTIAQEVLKQMQEQPQKSCALVLSKRDAETAAKVQECLGADVDVLFCGEDTAGRTPCRHLLPTLSCSDMAELATGRASTPELSEVLTLLLNGKTVEVCEMQYKAFADTAPGHLYDLYESYEKTLAGFGLKAFVPAAPDSVRVRENLITEQVVEIVSGQGASTMVVKDSALVTPLAVEAAKNLNITIDKSL